MIFLYFLYPQLNYNLNTIVLHMKLSNVFTHTSAVIELASSFRIHMESKGVHLKKHIMVRCCSELPAHPRVVINRMSKDELHINGAFAYDHRGEQPRLFPPSSSSDCCR